MKNTETPTLTAYFKAIRNSEKRRYAEGYLAHITTGSADPDVRRFNMRNWSPQDVRLRITAIMEAVS